ncbi:hypothetical protein BZG02_12580 [Labilibaculum filiforme]|uniref:DUF2752 domain-containing protein n=1 Tax=Labilibaculum filiforme TaxID=1940526 RepID=A0A2N3HWZ4_9BACT|nr:DUF2752 domain-containing protein [Labilibaculum filiforme]PKQ62548.1 hypothetical protein BZG02_12580 [Labilibaculum filiforme]
MSSSSYLAQQNYKIINLSLAGIILCIFSYATLFSPEESKHPIPSFYTQITKEASPSTGLSRCFSAIVRGNLQLAKTFNPYGLAIFLFFVVQFVFRVFSFIWINERYSWIKPYVLIDILFSTIGFYHAFKPLIFFTLKLFRETIVN